MSVFVGLVQLVFVVLSAIVCLATGGFICFGVLPSS
jgi:hypothetical protein